MDSRPASFLNCLRSGRPVSSCVELFTARMLLWKHGGFFGGLVRLRDGKIHRPGLGSNGDNRRRGEIGERDTNSGSVFIRTLGYIRRDIQKTSQIVLDTLSRGLDPNSLNLPILPTISHIMAKRLELCFYLANILGNAFRAFAGRLPPFSRRQTLIIFSVNTYLNLRQFCLVVIHY